MGQWLCCGTYYETLSFARSVVKVLFDGVGFDEYI